MIVRGPFVVLLSLGLVLNGVGYTFAEPTETPASQKDEEHIVQLDNLRASLLESSTERRHNVEAALRWVTSEPVRKKIESTQADPRLVEQSILLLSDEELRALAARANTLEHDVVAGDGANMWWVLGVVAVAGALVAIAKDDNDTAEELNGR